MTGSPSDIALALHHLHIASQHAATVMRARRGLDRSQYDALNELGGRSHLTVVELGRRLGLTSGAATKLVDRLETNGLIKRQADPNDRRRALVATTPAGRRLQHDIQQVYHRTAVHAVATMTDHERDALDKALQLILGQLDREPEPT